MVALSYNALKTKYKNSERTLIEILVEDNKSISELAAISSNLYIKPDSYTIVNSEIPENFLTSSSLFKDDTYTYYDDFFNNKGIYRKNIQTSEEVKISSSYSKILGICDKWIYFHKYEIVEGINGTYYSTGLFKIDKNGNNESFVLDGDYYLIYCDNDNIFYNTSWSEVKQTISYESIDWGGLPWQYKSSTVTIYDEEFIKHNQLIRLSHDKASKVIIMDNFLLSAYKVVNNILFYYRGDRSEISMVDLKSLHSKTLITNISLEEMDTDGKYIYYTNLSDEGEYPFL